MSRLTRAAAAALCSLTLFCSVAPAQQAAAYPTRPIRLIVPGAPGGLSDLLARAVTEPLGAALGQPVVIDNKTGADGTVAVQNAKGHNDGYTLLYHYTAYNQNLVFREGMPYTTADFIPVAQIATAGTAFFVPASLGVNNVAELVKLLKASPNKYAYGTAGVTGQIMMELLAKQEGLVLTHAAYKGEAPGATDLIGGQIAVFAGGSLGAFMPHVKSGRLKALAIAGETRSPAAPEVPTWGEAGYPALVIPSWTGIFVPAGTPAPVVRRLSDEITRIVRNPEIARKIEGYGAQAAPKGSAEFANFLDLDLNRWKNAAKVTGVKFQ
jgi:tripartite-type tricarboxylate transporter receptor subunit TctC